jgi:hypothetical protein
MLVMKILMTVFLFAVALNMEIITLLVVVTVMMMSVLLVGHCIC